MSENKLPFWRVALYSSASAGLGEEHVAGAFHLDRFGDMEPLFQTMAEALDETVAVPRPGLGAVQESP